MFAKFDSVLSPRCRARIWGSHRAAATVSSVFVCEIALPSAVACVIWLRLDFARSKFALPPQSLRHSWAGLVFPPKCGALSWMSVALVDLDII